MTRRTTIRRTTIRRTTIRPANGPVRIDRLAEALLDPVVSKAGFSSTQILAAWPQIVGPALADCSRPEKLRWPPRREDRGHENEEGTRSADAGATLVVRAEGGDAMELQYAADQIISRINAFFGWRAVARLTVHQGPVGELSTGRDTGASDAKTVEKDQDSEANERLKAVEDDDLRAALARLGAEIAADEDTKP